MDEGAKVQSNERSARNQPRHVGLRPDAASSPALSSLGGPRGQCRRFLRWAPPPQCPKGAHPWKLPAQPHTTPAPLDLWVPLCTTEDEPQTQSRTAWAEGRGSAGGHSPGEPSITVTFPCCNEPVGLVLVWDKLWINVLSAAGSCTRVLCSHPANGHRAPLRPACDHAHITNKVRPPARTVLSHAWPGRPRGR